MAGAIVGLDASEGPGDAQQQRIVECRAAQLRVELEQRGVDAGPLIFVVFEVLGGRDRQALQILAGQQPLDVSTPAELALQVLEGDPWLLNVEPVDVH
ncbi:MAG TPA: hypothetical protein VM869_32330, partial [Enhygromyxa sp.]|nr:hypothetical protein [Enhygromyxa sp.]